MPRPAAWPRQAPASPFGPSAAPWPRGAAVARPPGLPARAARRGCRDLLIAHMRACVARGRKRPAEGRGCCHAHARAWGSRGARPARAAATTNCKIRPAPARRGAGPHPMRARATAQGRHLIRPASPAPQPLPPAETLPALGVSLHRRGVPPARRLEAPAGAARTHLVPSGMKIDQGETRRAFVRLARLARCPTLHLACSFAWRPLCTGLKNENDR